MEDKHEQEIVWLRESEAAKEVGIPQSTLAGYVKRGLVETKRDVLDKRLQLVNVNQLKRLLQEHR